MHDYGVYPIMDTDKHNKQCRMDGDMPGFRFFDVERCARCRFLLAEYKAGLAAGPRHTVQLTDEERQELILALNMHRNWIETRDPLTTAGDVSRIKGNTIRALGDDQMNLIIRIRAILNKLEK